ncbi:PspC domain-containing protein [Antrihabitans cavernicola]|uniref:PspC domain-containing protein n=1 Tax=Antrihabitans cavernicola TaxID=2495913 RepID=A0A5A7SBN2_9NOCA|nr:PspC domain-containing protein [Spelaeibacter cavernicola]KAA0022729.1 PspC domain-containing protein [Spelaeibacter cavernicola]
MSKTTFPEQLQDMWRTRPVRLPDKGPLAGVAAGIGYRYGVDPVLIRVALVVSTIFGGAGIVLYLAGWLLLNQSGDKASAVESLFGRGQSSESQTKTIVLLVAFAIAISTVGPIGLGLGGAGIVSMVLMLGGLWLLHQRQPLAPPLPIGSYGSASGYPGTGYPATPFTAPTQVDVAEPRYTSPYSPYTRLPESYVPDPPKETKSAAPAAAPESAAATPKTETVSPAPPAWDPLGVAPFAWDLPEPAAAFTSPVRIPQHRPRSRLTTVTIGFAIIAAAGAAALAVTGVDWFTPGRIGAIGLGVVGLGLLIGAFLRRGYGLLVVTGPLVGFVVIASLIGPIDFDGSALGEKSWQPKGVADLQSSYSVLLGSGTLDLTTLNLTEDKTVKLDSQLGSIEVKLPNNLDVRKESSVIAGETTGLPDGLDTGADGAKGPVLTLDITSRLGSVDVHRGK